MRFNSESKSQTCKKQYFSADCLSFTPDVYLYQVYLFPYRPVAYAHLYAINLLFVFMLTIACLYLLMSFLVLV